MAFTTSSSFIRSSGPLEAGWCACGLAWVRLGRLVLLSRDHRTCRAQHIPRVARVRVATSRRLGIKCAASRVRLARPTRHAFSKKRRLYICWKPRVLFAVAACHGKELLNFTGCTWHSCLSRAPRPILVCGWFVPLLVVEVRAPAPTTNTWPGACRAVDRHIGADLTTSVVNESVAPVHGTVAQRCGDAVVHPPGF